MIQNRVGLVLAGGQGQRFGGVDKGLQPYLGQSMAITMLRRLEPFCSELILNCRAASRPQYMALIDALSWKCPCRLAPNTEADFPGPLAGILATQPFTASEYLLVPCDMPTLPHSILEELCRHGAQHPQANALYIRHQGMVQPLISLLRPTALNALVTAFHNGERSLRRLLLQLNAVPVDLFGPDLCNMNHPGMMIQMNENR